MNNLSRLHRLLPWMVYAALAPAALWEASTTPNEALALRLLAVAPVAVWLLIAIVVRRIETIDAAACLLPAAALFAPVAAGACGPRLAAALAPIAAFLCGLAASARLARVGRAGFIAAILAPIAFFFTDFAALPKVNTSRLYGQIWSPEEDVRWDLDLNTDYLRNYHKSRDVRLEDVDISNFSAYRRVVVLGASQVISPGIKDRSRTFPSVMEKRLCERTPEWVWRVGNAGVYGTDLIQWVYWRDILSRDKPDVLVIYDSGAMMAPFQDRVVFNRAERIDKGLPKNADEKFRRDAFRWGSSSRFVILARRLLYDNRIATRLVALERERRRPPAIDAETIIPGQEPPQPDRRTVLEWFAQSCRKESVRLILVPGVHRNLQFADPDYAKAMHQTASRYAVEWLDARPPEGTAGAENFFLDGSHFSIDGSLWLGELIADAILKKLEFRSQELEVGSRHNGEE